MDSRIDAQSYPVQVPGDVEPAGPAGAALSTGAGEAPGQGQGQGQGQAAREALEQLKRLLRRLRVEQGLSMAGLARRALLGRTTTSQALNGDTVPSEATLVSLAQALKTAPDPLLALRTLARPGGSAPAVVAAASTGSPAQRPGQDARKTSRPEDDQETRFTYDYLDRRPTSLLRVLHGKLRDSPLIRLRIRTVDLCRSVQLNDPELPALMVQYADECLAFKSQANSRRDVAEAMLLVACLTTAGQARASSEAAQESVNDHVYGTAMVFLDHFGIESLDFLQMQGLTERNIGTGIRPWSCLEDFESRIPDDLFSPSL